MNSLYFLRCTVYRPRPDHSHWRCLNPTPSQVIKSTRDLPGVALVITFFTTLFTKRKLDFWTNAPFCKFYNMILKTSQQWFQINGKNAFGCPLHLGLNLKVECMNLSETNFSRIAESQKLWQGAICHVWTSQFNKHWRQSQKENYKTTILDIWIWDCAGYAVFFFRRFFGNSKQIIAEILS